MKPGLITGCVSATLLLACLTASAAPPERDPRVERIVRNVSPKRILANIEKLVSFGTRHTLSDTSDPAHGIGAARRWIKSEFERYAPGGRLKVSFDEFPAPPSIRIPRGANIVNVVATLTPRDTSTPDAHRVIVIGGHYDSRATDVLDGRSDAPGADDDGSGTALVLELARVLSGEDFRATLVFICYAGEEQGLYGSTHWAESARNNGEHVEACLNNDIVGAVRGGNGETDRKSVRVFSPAFSAPDTGRAFRERTMLGLENDGGSRSLARYVEETGARYVPGFKVRLIYRADRFLRGGDQLPFQQAGYSAVRFTESKEDFDHQHQDVRTFQRRVYGDLPKFIDAEYCANVARVNAATAASLAFATAPPVKATLVVAHLAYDSQLRWEKSSDDATAGYLVRWRSTSSHVWEHSMFTPDTTVTLNVSKDANLFGVQSLTKSGNASLYALPLPGR